MRSKVLWVRVGDNPPLISCSVEYLHFGGRKALMLKAAGAEGKKGLKGIKFFYN
ncbi:MAG: hypothetical protein F6K39_05750 [Okeania sp. SIO3B3]|nr:hypothetical protein [Okeania sp. SIO3B3]